MKLRLLAIGLCAVLSACAEVAPPGPPPPPPEVVRAPPAFLPSEFAWSTERGSATVRGLIDYSQNGRHYGCAGQVVLTPDAPYSRQRILALYGSTEHAVLPVEEVRSRQAHRPSDDYSAYVRKASCDAGGHFVFAGLPTGAWFVILVADLPGGGAPPLALMRRVETRPGAVRTIVLQ